MIVQSHPADGAAWTPQKQNAWDAVAVARKAAMEQRAENGGRPPVDDPELGSSSLQVHRQPGSGGRPPRPSRPGGMATTPNAPLLILPYLCEGGALGSMVALWGVACVGWDELPQLWTAALLGATAGAGLVWSYHRRNNQPLTFWRSH